MGEEPANKAYLRDHKKGFLKSESVGMHTPNRIFHEIISFSPDVAVVTETNASKMLGTRTDKIGVSINAEVVGMSSRSLGTPFKEVTSSHIRGWNPRLFHRGTLLHRSCPICLRYIRRRDAGSLFHSVETNGQWDRPLILYRTTFIVPMVNIVINPIDKAFGDQRA